MGRSAREVSFLHLKPGFLYTYMDNGEQLELESLGILRATRIPENLAWVDADTLCLLLQMLAAGEEGVHKRVVEKFRKAHEETLVRLEMSEFAQWQRDKCGREMFFALTWKGQEAATLLYNIAKNQTRRSCGRPTS